jgi:DNA ligase-1
MQSAPLAARSCKHLAALRGGADREEARVAAAGGAAAGGGAGGGAKKPQAAAGGGATAKKKSTAAAADATATTTAAPKLMLAHSWDSRRDLTGWLASEKLDGVRALWTGTALLSRQGNTFNPPPGWASGLPADVALDGELWLGRGRFDEASGLARTGAAAGDAAWAALQFMIFDAPRAAGGFEARMSVAAAAIVAAPCARLVAHAALRSNAELTERMDAIVALKGEGMMV